MAIPPDLIMVIQVCLTFYLLLKQISYHGSEEGGESEDSEGENQELAQIDRGVCICYSNMITVDNCRIFYAFINLVLLLSIDLILKSDCNLFAHNATFSTCALFEVKHQPRCGITDIWEKSKKKLVEPLIVSHIHALGSSRLENPNHKLVMS